VGISGIGVYGHGGEHDFFAHNGNYGAASSIRWKNDVRPIDEPLRKILCLRGVYFSWDVGHGGKHDIGMIAEEVGEVVPEIVGYEENGKDATGMDYGKLTPLLVEAVKALKMEKDAEITELKGQISKMELLRKENAELRQRVGALESIVVNPAGH
ncbi:MAG: tail fiber domain-containing protein, partial [Planctomycetota bacterium]